MFCLAYSRSLDAPDALINVRFCKARARQLSLPIRGTSYFCNNNNLLLKLSVGGKVILVNAVGI